MTRRFARRLDVPCTVELVQTSEAFHAFAIPQGVALRPGDRVVVHDAPRAVAFGESTRVTCRATVIRAGWLARAWTRTAALLELTGLYHVGFEPKEELP